ncbi:ricin-type beta-trefoil lectin domain protein [Streptomyces goshikiensis]|uniref:ricin-type beta-trefoil lectin domain protein n=1 Tax=Streptomyces goshikiensis TaxID=1942 RepID=UPI0036BFEBEC
MSAHRPRAARMTSLLVAASTATAGLVLSGTAHALNGPEVPSGAHTATVRLTIGDEANSRGCTATLISESWLAAAASCFAATPGAELTAGEPALKTVATLSNGRRLDVADLAPRSDRDLVLARLARPVTDVAPARVATAAPKAGGELTAVGFGRTKSEWTPSKPHSGTFVTNAVDTTALTVTGKGTDVLCKGDTGAPLLNAAGELVAVGSRSWQGGCLGTDPAEKRTGAIASRIDDLASWIRSAQQRPVILKGGQSLQPGEMIVSENAKLVMQTDGNLVLYHATGGEGRGAALWASHTGGNPGAYATVQGDGNFVVYKKDGKVGDLSAALWDSKTFHNDGARVELQADANLVVYTKDGGHGIGGHLWHSDTYPRGDRLNSDARLMPGQWLTNGKYALIMDIQGNPLLRELGTGRELWAQYKWDWGSYLHMQGDGNLTLYKKGGGNGNGALWSSGTWDGAGSYATLENSGSLVVRGQSGGERWATGSLRGQQSGRCLDSYNDADAVIWDCWGGANQQWDHTSAKELRNGTGKCLTAESGAGQGSHLASLPCDGRSEQKWNVNGATIASAARPEQCVNVFSEATGNGSVVGLWQCGNGTNAQWTRP